jgi:hypothetical protein
MGEWKKRSDKGRELESSKVPKGKIEETDGGYNRAAHYRPELIDTQSMRLEAVNCGALLTAYQNKPKVRRIICPFWTPFFAI